MLLGCCLPSCSGNGSHFSSDFSDGEISSSFHESSSSSDSSPRIEKISFSSVETTMTDNKGEWPYGESKPIESVIDGDSNTTFVRAWIGKEKPGMIDFQLNGSYLPTAMLLEWGVPDSEINDLSVATTYSVFGSSDGIFYAPLEEKKDLQGLSYRKDAFEIFSKDAITHLRICVYESSGNYLSLSEVALYGYPSAVSQEKIFATNAFASQETENHEASNLLNETDSTWRANIWEKGSLGGASNQDVTLTLTLSQLTSIEGVYILLAPYIWDPEYDEYERVISLSCFEMEFSQDGINYQKAYEYEGNAKAYRFEPLINQTYGIRVSDFLGGNDLAMYVRIIFRKFEHLCLQEVFFTGTSSSNGLLNKGAFISLGTEEERAGILFKGELEKEGARFSYQKELGVKAAFKKDLIENGYQTLTEMIKDSHSNEVLSFVAKVDSENSQRVSFSGFLSGLSLDDFDEAICYLPYLKSEGSVKLGIEGECTYSNLAKAKRFLYPKSGDWKPNAKDFTRIIDGKEYFDVYKASTVTPIGEDASILFPESVSGYYISSGTFEVDEDTFNRLLKSDLIGDGAIKWIGYKVENYMNNPDPFDGVLPISRINDPLYVMMCKPNEQHSFMDTNDDGTYNPNGRVNSSNFYPPTKDYKTLMTIGAVFINPEMKDLYPSNTEITVCFGKMKLAVCTDKNGWELITDQVGPSHPGAIYYLPWTLDYDKYNDGKMNYYLPSDSIKKMDDHIEVKVSVEDFLQSQRRKEYPDVKGGVLHFWGGKDSGYEFEDGVKVLGIASSYEIWVKEKQYSNLLTADIGADMYLEGVSHPDQAFTGYNFAVTNQKRLVYGHNVGPRDYDKVMDSKKVCQMLGIL